MLPVKTNQYHWRSILAGVLFSTLTISAPLFADDTEVFFGQVDSSVEAHPNVMFVLDTSGSMRLTDDTSKTRLQRMKDALTAIIDSATDVNVGLMRFNGGIADGYSDVDGGGAVIYPVTPIDKRICLQDDCGAISFTRQTNVDLADVEETLNDNTVTDDSELHLGYNGSGSGFDQSVGLRFTDIDIPSGSTIVRASIEFTASGDDTSPAKFSVSTEDVDTSELFTTADADVSDRSLIGISEEWEPEGWAAGAKYSTPSLTALVQDMVDRPGWCGGSALNFIVKNDGSTGKRRAESFNSSAENAPKLKLTYDTSAIPADEGCSNQSTIVTMTHGDDDTEELLESGLAGWLWDDEIGLNVPLDYYGYGPQAVGIRFRGIDIPQGATIASAHIEFTVLGQTNYGDVNVMFQGLDQDNAPGFTHTRYSLSGATKTTANVLWSNPPILPANDKINSVDISPILQEIVDRDGWNSGNAMSLAIRKTSGSGTRSYQSYNYSASGAPKLVVNFQGNTSATAEPTYVTARDQLKQVVADMEYEGYTPIVDSMYEAIRYFRGDDVLYGKSRSEGTGRSRKHRVSHPESYSGGTVHRDSDCTDDDLNNSECWDEYIDNSPVYISPMASSCQTNQIVLLSDGVPTETNSLADIKSMIGKTSSEACTHSDSDGECGLDLAEWAHDTDHNPHKNSVQNLTTHTIGFNIDADYLKQMAISGGGSYYTADSSADLVTSFQSILNEVAEVDTSFVSAGATVNQFNRLTHRNDLYFALFRPQQRPTWHGNLKKYQIGETESGKKAIMDYSVPTPQPAVDGDTGNFTDTSRSGWLKADEDPDGNNVALGGAGSRQELSSIPGGIGNRRVYTYTGNYNVLPKSLDHSDHALHEDNNNVNVSMLNVTGESSPSTFRTNLLKWARGVDVKDDDDDGSSTDVRKHMGDPMHSRPVIVNYANSSDPDSSHSLVFTGTNEGYLHAINTEDGHEQYSFVPPELLPNLRVFYDNKPAAHETRPYGLDGTLAVWTKDIDGDTIIDSGDEAHLFVGMRRGGKNYYSLDISDRLDPQLSWVIEGGKGDFTELGQSWSTPVATKMVVNGAEKDVLIFAAGYDESQDPTEDAVTHIPEKDQDGSATQGRGLFIVDIETGDKLWSVGHTSSAGSDQTFADMKYSIPSDIRAIDIDFDGLVDQLYVGDLGGQLWRFDVVKSHSSGSDLLTGGVMAKLSGSAKKDQRRFFQEPDVALVGYEGDRFLTISIGSGWRAHPLDRTTEDRIYVLRSTSIYGAPDGYGKPTISGESVTWSPITESDLVQISTDLNPTINEFGWYLDLEGTGEKILVESITVDNKVFIASYNPGISAGDCSPAVGGGSAYVLSVVDGDPVTDTNNDGTVNSADRKIDLASSGIPTKANALITEDKDTGELEQTVSFGTEILDMSIGNLTKRTFWVDMSDVDD